jgi:hypothetical protein
MYSQHLLEGAMSSMALIFIAGGIITGSIGSWVASQKGYSPGWWFVICFLFSAIGLIAISGSPSKFIENDIRDIKNKLSKQDQTITSKQNPTPTTNNTGPVWVCKKCKEKNQDTSLYCKNCGEYK